MDGNGLGRDAVSRLICILWQVTWAGSCYLLIHTVRFMCDGAFVEWEGVPLRMKFIWVLRGDWACELGAYI